MKLQIAQIEQGLKQLKGIQRISGRRAKSAAIKVALDQISGALADIRLNTQAQVKADADIGQVLSSF